jgi:integrase
MQVRDLAMFNLAIDSKLRGCDLVSLRVRDVTTREPGIWRRSDGRCSERRNGRCSSS